MGYLVGLAHEIGKYCGSYQRYIRGGGSRIDHSTAGAKELYRIGAKEASFCVAGHHSGLPQEGRPEDLPDKVSLFGRLKREIPDYGAFGEEITFPEPESRVFESQFQRMFFVRMLFSSLTDADFLATEEFMSGGETERGGYDELSTLLERFESCMEEKGWGAPKTPVDRMRREILTRCREAANGERGIYSLTAPTGSGKTAASLAFALRHGVKQGMRRVIYVIPHTSVIEQTAKVFREMLGEENVLEHHGGVSFDKADGGLAEKLRLSAENWDAPVIVTTSAQFFQSLYGNRPAQCRKLHNIAQSVVVLDEVQLLPLSSLRPCAAAVEALCRDYGATALFCTATQPSLRRIFGGGAVLREICPDVGGHFETSRRVLLRDMGRQDGGLAEKLRLSAENWDAPVIVTTSAQFFQSLYGNRPAQCRKLHNIAQSVVVLDEVQLLPLSSLRPCAAAVEALCRDYGATALFCTATQPSLRRIFGGGAVLREICPDVGGHFETSRRVLLRDMGRQSLGSIAGQMGEIEEALAVVNSKERAGELFDLLPREGRFYLSANLCSAHRGEVLEAIRERLLQKRPCRVVSTSLVEAGVDLDFPAVFREAAGLPSILQAAGRCNREGKLSEGIVSVFWPEGKIPAGIQREALLYRETAERFADILSPQAIRWYFDALYRLQTRLWGEEKGLDRRGILLMIQRGVEGSMLPFPQVARAFRLIEEERRCILIPWDEKAREIRGKLFQGKPSRRLLRRAGRYLVNVPPSVFERLLRTGKAVKITEEFGAAKNLEGLYSLETGLLCRVEPRTAALSIEKGV